MLATKLVAIMITWMLMIYASAKITQEERDLNQVLFICYLVLFQKMLIKYRLWNWLTFKIKKRANLIYMAQLVLQVQNTDSGTKKLNVFL